MDSAVTSLAQAAVKKQPAAPQAAEPAATPEEPGMPDFTQVYRDFQTRQAEDAKTRAELMQQEKSGEEEAGKLTQDIESGMGQESVLSADMMKKVDSLNATMNSLMQERRKQSVFKAGELKRFMPIAIAFGALGTALTRGNIAYGMQAMAAGLAGYATGKKSNYDTAYQQWKDSMDSAISESQATISAAQNVINNNQLTMQNKLDLLKIVSGRVAHLSTALKSGDMDAYLKNLNTWAGALEKFKKIHGDALGTLSPSKSKQVQAAVYPRVLQFFNLPADTTSPEYTGAIQSASILTHVIAENAAIHMAQNPKMTLEQAAGLAVSEAQTPQGGRKPLLVPPTKDDSGKFVPQMSSFVPDYSSSGSYGLEPQ